MPRQIQAKKMNKKRKRTSTWLTASSKRPRSHQRTNLIRNPDYGFPDKMRSRIRYCDAVLLSGAGIQKHVVRMNSCRDPDLTGAGHQPMWFDQYCGATAPYNKYRVLGSKLTAKFTVLTAPATTVTNPTPVCVGIVPSGVNSLAITNTYEFMETTDAVWEVLTDKSGGNNVKTCTVSYSPKRNLGVSQDDDTVAAAYGSDPATGYFAHMFRSDQSSVTSVEVYWQIEFLVEFHDRNQVVGS